MLGSMATVALPDGPSASASPPLYIDRLQDVLIEEHRIEVPVFPWPAPPRRWLRISAQLYNALTDYERLAALIPLALADVAAS
jgi:isopenicillin-N epimerase